MVIGKNVYFLRSQIVVSKGTIINAYNDKVVVKANDLLGNNFTTELDNDSYFESFEDLMNDIKTKIIH
jgi:hypothetical protein